MKKLLNIFLIVLVVFMAACTADPFTDLEGSDWQKERNIVSLLLEGQIGTAQIQRDFNDANINVYAKFENIADISKVEIKSVDFAYGATSQNITGTTLDFTDGTASISVISGSGETLEWDVTLNSFKSDLEGEWYIGEIRMYCDMFTWESWGWEKNEKITDYLPELNPELDNVITFTVEGADEKGNPFGNYEHSAGNDDVYGNFGDTEKGWDFNERFRKIPAGNGTWVRDFERNVVIITGQNKQEYELDLELLTETNEVSLKATLPYLSNLFSWDNTDWSYEELAHMSNSMWYKLTRDRILQTGNSITNITVKDQDGDAQVNADAKEITITIPDNGANLASIELTALELSYAATANVSVGGTLDFSTDNSASITVTSEVGEASVWTIKLVLKSDLEGSWAMPNAVIYVSQEWGSDFNKNIGDDFPNASQEFDNEVIIVSEGYSGDKPNGKITNNAGADGLFGDFNHADADVDLNSKLRHLLPEGESYWEIDLSINTIYFGTSKDDLTSEAKIVSTDTGMILEFEIPYKTTEPRWDYGNYDNYMCWVTKYEIYLDKQ